VPDGLGTDHDAGGGSTDTAEDARVTTTTMVDEAWDEDVESDRRRRDTDDARDNPASRHPPVVHERDHGEQDSAGDDADTPAPRCATPSRRLACRRT
jgi:hypothetical protein